MFLFKRNTGRKSSVREGEDNSCRSMYWWYPWWKGGRSQTIAVRCKLVKCIAEIFASSVVFCIIHHLFLLANLHDIDASAYVGRMPYEHVRLEGGISLSRALSFRAMFIATLSVKVLFWSALIGWSCSMTSAFFTSFNLLLGKRMERHEQNSEKNYYFLHLFSLFSILP